MTAPWYIETADGLAELVRRARGHAHLAVDTEFVGEDTFVPRLELVQIAAGDVSAVVDVPAVGSLEVLWDLLRNAAVEKVFHAGRQDLEIFLAHTNVVPGPFFDTQVAAAMVGYGTQISYAQLVERVVGTRLAKSHTLTNWSHRPLTADQLAYAVEDVRYLLPVREHLVRRLHTLGRTEWVQEEFSRLAGAIQESAKNPGRRYERIKGWESLRPQAVAVLRELVVWRDHEARRRNVPRGRIIRDEILVELARHQPQSVAALRATRGVNGAEVERSGEAIVAAIKQGLALPKSEWPEAPKPNKTRAELPGKVELLQAVLKARAAELDMAPTLLATVADLQELADAAREGPGANIPLIHGWRRELAGEFVLKVLEGRVQVAIDRKTGALRFSPSAEGS